VEWKSRSATLTQKHGDYFLNSDELQTLEQSENFQWELFKLWSLKESAFKCFYQNHPAPDLLLKHIHLKDFDPISSLYVFENSLQKNTFCQSRFYSLAILWDDPNKKTILDDDLLLSISWMN
jgi:phosphopantetheinyl transferase (holo-ACP synthase)